MTKPTRAARLQQRSRQRRESEKLELRQAILDAAVKLFVEHGYSGFSLRQVAEQVGYSPGTIYLYFSDKDDLLFNVADAGFRRFQAFQQEAAARSDDPLEKLRNACRAYIAFGTQYPAYYHLMFQERPDLLFQARKEEAGTWLETLESYQALFHGLKDAGMLRDGNLVSMSDAWWATLHGIVTLANSMSYFFDQERVANAVEAALTMLLEGFIKPS
ncbi:MAG: TetR/AcrR family transcriptional regulator [Anaerolineae bacterium]|nr:TetR/AcrR family transcriptional regulator [Anaerolineae bacterium]